LAFIKDLKNRMNSIKAVFGRFWALWGLLSFVGTFLIILIPSLLTALIPDPRGMEYFLKLSWILVRT